MAVIRFLALACAMLFGALSAPASAQAEGGRLVIVGGGLSLDNADVYHAFIDNRAEGSPGIAIIAAASASPSGSGATFAGELMFYGVAAEDIAIVQLAMLDDPDTPDVDESEWAGNAVDPEQIAVIESAGAIWFTGGDQMRLRQLLIAEDGADTPMLAAIRARLEAGAVIGGSSAGAAAMSDPMIAGGDPFGGLFGEVLEAGPAQNEESGSLVLDRGLGFFTPGLVDQHFAQRGRFGRLARAIMAQPAASRTGIGIDEDTALLVDRGDHAAWVVGRGTVTALDGRQATVSATGFADIRLSRLHGGDMLDLSTLAVTPASGRQPVTARPSVFGGLWPSVRLADPLESETRQLFTSEQRRAATARFEVNLAEDKRGAIFVFVADARTRYWRSAEEEGWNGTLSGVRLSLTTGAPQPYRH
jgi:cyanophycinase